MRCITFRFTFLALFAAAADAPGGGISDDALDTDTGVVGGGMIDMFGGVASAA